MKSDIFKGKDIVIDLNFLYKMNGIAMDQSPYLNI